MFAPNVGTVPELNGFGFVGALGLGFWVGTSGLLVLVGSPTEICVPMGFIGIVFGIKAVRAGFAIVPISVPQQST